MTTIAIRPSKAPNLPIAPVEYSQQYQDQFSNALRLYFAQVDNSSQGTIANILSLTTNYGAWHDLTDQTATLITAIYPIQIGGVADYVRNFSIITGPNGPTQMTAGNAGLYNFQFSLQLSNDTSQNAVVTVWWRLNGVDLDNTASSTAVIAKTGAINGLTILSMNVIIQMAAGDNVEMYWQSDRAGVKIITLPAGVAPNPITPASPGVIVTVFAVA